MAIDRRSLVRFAWQFVALLALLAFLYPLLLPGYQRLLVGTTSMLARALSPPLAIEEVENGAWRVFRLEADGRRYRVFSIPRATLAQIHASVLLLPALLLATPVPLRRRFVLLAIGLALLVGLQVVTHLWFAWAWVRYRYSDPQHAGYKAVVVVHSISGQLYPAALWGLLTWRDWLPRRSLRDRDANGPGCGRPSRNAPCPCGSGRKYKRCCGRA